MITLYFEILENNKVLKRGTELLNQIAFSNELMYVPSMSLELPITYEPYLTGRPEIKVYLNQKIFHGLVTGFNLNNDNQTISINMDHVINEWSYRQISVNLAVDQKTIKELYSSLKFKYSQEWELDFQNNSGMRQINYVYSRQDKLAGLNKTMELTDDLFWRVGFTGEKLIEIGTFGKKTAYVISVNPSTKRNIRLLGEPVITHSFENVINIATVYSDKSDCGMSSMSLREVFNDPSKQKSEFPVYILNEEVNNERQYNYGSYTELAPNNALEYAIVDKESIAIEGGTLLEGSFSFDDLSPFSTDGEEITNEDRVEAAVTAYEAAIRKLKNARRACVISLMTEELPTGVNVGDQIRLVYDHSILELGECSNYLRKLLTLDDWFYITSIDYTIDETGVETNTIGLVKYIRIDRENN